MADKLVLKASIDTEEAERDLSKLSDQITGPLNDAVESTVSNLGSAFVDFARTGELSVRDMVNSIIADLARIAFDSFIEDGLTSFLTVLGKNLGGLFSGASATGLGKTLKPEPKALGGSVSFGRPYVVGEQGRELFVPESSGRIVPNNMLGGGGIIFNVQATDASSFRRSESQIAAMLHRVASRGQRNL